MIKFVYRLCSPTPSQIQYGRLIRALARKFRDMICDQIRMLYLLFLWLSVIIMSDIVSVYMRNSLL